MKYTDYLIGNLERISSELDHLLQEGAIFSYKEKEEILKILNNLESLVDEFYTY